MVDACPLGLHRPARVATQFFWVCSLSFSQRILLTSHVIIPVGSLRSVTALYTPLHRSEEYPVSCKEACIADMKLQDAFLSFFRDAKKGNKWRFYRSSSLGSGHKKGT